MKTSGHFLFKYILILLHLVMTVGCAASTKPNIPYSGPYPAAFNHLANQHPLLPEELGKIPEIQDGISEIDATALERIWVLYNQNQKNFDSAFERMKDIYPSSICF